MSNRCLRVLADPVQIQTCKETIDNIQNTITYVSQIFNLAGNEVRLKILFLLYKEEQMCPCDLSDVLDMTVPAVSQHLRKLKDARMVVDKKVGQSIFYSIKTENTETIIPVLIALVGKTHKVIK